MSVMHDSTEIFTLDTLQIKDDEPRFMFDSIASIAVQNTTIAFAGHSREGGDPIGTGIYVATDSLFDKMEWHRFEQPIDVSGDSLAEFGLGYFKARPLVGTRGVVSYDMDIEGNYLWITSWYGGLRRIDLTKMEKWERIPLPLNEQQILNTCDINQYEKINNELILSNYYWDSSDPDGNHNHKGFSIEAYGDTIWVGTANGINRGILGENDCIDWRHYAHPTDNLSGNWVLGIAKQEFDGKRIIWAITRIIVPTEERNSVSFTRDDGATWEIAEALVGENCHDITVFGSTILVASDNGLWKSNNGFDWELIPPVVEATPISSNEILNNTVYSVTADDREYFGNPFLWIGTPDGLARSFNFNANNWKVYRAENEKYKIYAYPNPFSPYSHNQLNNDGWVRFNIGEFAVEQIDMHIYNFTLEKVYTAKFNWRTNPGAIKWNGRDDNGELVSNGVYFINLQFSESGDSNKEDHWLKLAVVK